MNTDLNDARTLEDVFFMKKDKVLMENLKKMKQMKETKENLSLVSGIRNEQILQKLVELEIQPHTISMLSLIPLIEVAWSDGNVSKKEKEAILLCAERAGMKKYSMDHEILDVWLTNPPDKKMLNAWIHYIQGLCEKLSPSEKTALKQELMNHTHAVAEASGGILGIGSVSKQEQDMINLLENAFDMAESSPNHNKCPQ